MKTKIILLALSLLFLMIRPGHAQNIGISTTSPLSKLHMTSSTGNNLMLENLNTLASGTSNSIYFTNNVNSADAYRYTGAIKVIGTTSSTARMGLFTFATNTSGQLKERLSILDNGSVGIGKTNPDYALDVAGTGNFDGDLTVNDGKGIMRSTNSTQLKYYSRDAAFNVGLGAFESADGSLGYANANFNSPPRILIGDVVSGTGEFHKLRIVIFDVTATNCKVRVYNESNGTINVDAVWSVICIGN